jgi:RimJ/RimL family protein N-acetyltransferase
MVNNISLREFEVEDLKFYFKFQKDKAANFMAAFTIKNPDSWNEFESHWHKILGEKSNIIRSIVYKNRVIGNVLSFILDGEREISYWVDRKYWGKGIATKAVRLFLDELAVRPLYARAAYDNIASIAVLYKYGFTKIGSSKFFANARGEEIVEEIFILKN